MKRILTLALALLCLILGLMTVEARAVEVSGTCGDDVMWSLSSSGELRIYGNGEIANYSEESDVPWFQYKTMISSLIIEEGITTIKGCGFKNCSALTSISIASSVTEISNGAFSGCSSLVEIELPFVGAKPLIVEGETIYPFGYIFGGLSYEGSMAVTQRLYTPDTSVNSYTTYYIPESLTTVTITDYDLYPGAFYDCNNLTTIVLCEGINSVGKSAFFHCDQLITVKLPLTLVELGSGAFEDCSSLVSISLPDQIMFLDEYVFADCIALENVTLPAQLETIGRYAFNKCESLSSINLPASIRTIDSYAFRNCGLQSISLPEGIVCVNSQAFLSCESLSSVFLPSSLVDMSNHIFDNCPGLTSAGPATGDYCIRYAWSDEIPAFAFSGCAYLTTAVLPNDITAIPSNLFSNCSRLENIEIPASVTSIGSGAFSNCDALENIIVPGKVTTIDYNAFSRCRNLKYIVFPKSVVSMGWGLLDGCSALDAIFYFGTEKDWNNIEIKNNSNTVLTDTVRYYITSYSDICNIVGHNEVIDVAVEATCTETGLTEGKYCSVCGEILVAQETIDILGHDMSQWQTITVPTCTEDGTEIRSCSRCDITENRTINALGHRYSTVTTAPTCTEKGYATHTCTNCSDSYTDTFVDALGHALGNWVTDSEPTCTENGKQYRVCFRCAYSEERTINSTGHSHTAIVTAPTCTEQGFTTYACPCGDSYVSDYVDSLGHDMGEWKTVTAHTCTENGFESRSCSRCDHTETRVIDATGHSYTAVVTTATCTEQGFTTYTCVCGDSYVSDYVDALGHDMGEWKAVTDPTCTEDGSESRSCSRCEYTETRAIDAVGHSYTGTVTAPTCTEQGFTTYTCSCGDTYVSNEIPALGHTEETIPAVAATCIETGLTEGKKCSVCGEILVAQEVVPALGHDWKGTSCQHCDATRENPFADVEDGSFYIDPVLWAVENGITNGATPTTFNPNGTCLRAHVVTFLHRVAKSPEPSSTKNPFTDVKPGDFYYKPVLWAVEKGITNGISATKFGSVDVCNRAAVVTFLWRAAGSPEPKSTRNPFEDVKTTDFFYKPVLWAVENGITNGVDATHFGPATDCNRAQVVTFLYRAYN